MTSKKLFKILLSLLILQSIWRVNCEKKLNEDKGKKSMSMSKYLESCIFDKMNIKMKELLSDFKTCLKNIDSKEKFTGKQDEKSRKLWSKVLKTTIKCLKSKSSKINSKGNENAKKRQKRSKPSIKEEIALLRQSTNSIIMKKLEEIENVYQCEPSKSKILFFSHFHIIVCLSSNFDTEKCSCGQSSSKSNTRIFRGKPKPSDQYPWFIYKMIQ